MNADPQTITKASLTNAMRLYASWPPHVQRAADITLDDDGEVAFDFYVTEPAKGELSIFVGPLGQSGWASLFNGNSGSGTFAAADGLPTVAENVLKQMLPEPEPVGGWGSS